MKNGRQSASSADTETEETYQRPSCGKWETRDPTDFAKREPSLTLSVANIEQSRIIYHPESEKSKSSFRIKYLYIKFYIEIDILTTFEEIKT